MTVYTTLIDQWSRREPFWSYETR